MEPPLGLLALQTYLNSKLKENIHGKIIKSRVDFDSYDELNKLITKFKPDAIGVSAMTFHKDFFHESIKSIREFGYDKTIIVGGPHPTTSFNEVLEDKNIDICVIGGEVTLTEIIQKMMSKNNEKLDIEELKQIDGIAFIEDNFVNTAKYNLSQIKPSSANV